MKFLNVFIVLSLLSIGFFTSCNPGQNRVNKVEGEWELADRMVFINSELQPTDTTLANSSIIYTFTPCDLAEQEYCSASITIANNSGTDTSDILYRFEDGGNTIVIDYDAATASDQIVAEVTKLSSTEFVFEYTVEIVDTQRVIFAMQKI